MGGSARRMGLGRGGSGTMSGAGSAVVSLTAAIGMVVGVRSVAAVELPGVRSLLRLPLLPHESLGIAWTSRMVWAARIQAAALDRLAALVVGLFLAGAAVAMLDTFVLLLERGSARRHEVAVRAALGATPASLVRLLLGQLRRLLTLSGALGLLLGLTTGGAMRAAWPEALQTPHVVAATAELLPAMAVLMALAAAAYVAVGFSVGRRAGLAAVLASGRRATAEPAEAFQRRALSALQMGAAGAVALGAVALALAVGETGRGGNDMAAHDDTPSEHALTGPVDGTAVSAESDAPTATTFAVSVRSPAGKAGGAAWEALMGRLARVPGLEAESLATPGTLSGLGVRDNATAQCGNCVRGGLPAPFWGVVADHHAVAPGYFRAVGLRLAAGRDLTAADGPEAPRVAVVNRTFANTAFEKGDPLGHLIRLGSELDAWYEVVGVVEDTDAQAVGRDDLARSAVYLSALQQPPEHADVLLRGDDDAVAEAVDVLAAAHYSPGEAVTVDEVRARAAAPLRWLARLAFLLGLLTLALAVHGGHATALQVTRRRMRELAVRRVLGAADGRILRHVLLGSARTALFGGAVAVFFGSLAVGLLRKSTGGVAPLGPGAYVAVVALLVGAAVAASVRAAREALAVEPAEVVE